MTDSLANRLVDHMVEYHLLALPWSTVSRARERGRRPDGLPVTPAPSRTLRDRLMTEVFHAGH